MNSPWVTYLKNKGHTITVDSTSGRIVYKCTECKREFDTDGEGILYARILDSKGRFRYGDPNCTDIPCKDTYIWEIIT